MALNFFWPAYLRRNGVDLIQQVIRYRHIESHPSPTVSFRAWLRGRGQPISRRVYARPEIAIKSEFHCLSFLRANPRFERDCLQALLASSPSS